MIWLQLLSLSLKRKHLNLWCLEMWLRTGQLLQLQITQMKHFANIYKVLMLAWGCMPISARLSIMDDFFIKKIIAKKTSRK
ncbi:DUF645 family protein [Pseudoalteromonas sp. S16_S37]|nr:DUF645 family protein [Pseudoalteromonas sp. S16_S37]